MRWALYCFKDRPQSAIGIAARSALSGIAARKVSGDEQKFRSRFYSAINLLEHKNSAGVLLKLESSCYEIVLTKVKLFA